MYVDINDPYMADTSSTNPVQSSGPHGAELMVWEYLDRPRYERGRLWYMVMIAAGAGLLLYALLSANFLFALIIVMFALVLYVSTIYEPKLIRFTITEEGIGVGESFYTFRDIERFWFYYDPPMARSLYLEFRSAAPRVRVDLATQDPNIVRQLLGQFVREDLNEVDEPLSDIISRILKI